VAGWPGQRESVDEGDTMIRLQLNWTGLNQGFSLFHFDGDETAGSASASALATMIGAWDTLMVPAQTWSIDPEGLEVDIGTGQTLSVFPVTTASGAGANAGTPVPQAASVLMRWRTGVFTAGREIRGRTFIPGMNQSQVSAQGEVLAGARTSLDSAANTFISTTDFGIYSPTHSTFATVATASAWSEYAVLRSRRE
jgi:hypothetical protein